jgi:hypothetical protein
MPLPLLRPCHACLSREKCGWAARMICQVILSEDCAKEIFGPPAFEIGSLERPEHELWACRTYCTLCIKQAGMQLLKWLMAMGMDRPFGVHTHVVLTSRYVYRRARVSKCLYY